MEKWIENLTNEISTEFHNKYLLEKFHHIVNNNHELRKMNGTVLTWMHNAFTDDLVISIGRICDGDNRTDSLLRFLKALKDKPEYLTRERHVKFYEPNPIISFGDLSFDKLAGQGQTTFPISIILADIENITNLDPVRKVLQYRNTYIAHNDRNKTQNPTFEELFEAFKIVEDIIKKYNLLIRASALRTATPTIQGDWQEVFTIPWVKSSL